MARPIIQLGLGTKYGRLTIIGPAIRCGGRLKWPCVCDCGQLVAKHGAHLRQGRTSSCGCLMSEPWLREKAAERATKHGASKSTAWAAWRRMRSRCYSPTDDSYFSYGGRGIKVCDRWLGHDGFANFLADMGERPPGMTLDRIKVNEDYGPENCRWATNQEQQNNKRNNVRVRINGETMTLTQAARKFDVTPSTALQRRRAGRDLTELFGRSVEVL